MALRYREEEMTPVHKIMRLTHRRGAPAGPSREECWEAYSVDADGRDDGRWAYRRVDGVPGTPWEIAHGRTGMDYPGMDYGRLDDARHATHTRSGEILAAIRAEALRTAEGAAFMASSREAARMALPILDAEIAALGLDAVVPTA